MGIFDFVILVIDLALNMYYLRSWDYSAHALSYAIVFLEEKLLLLAYYVAIKYEVLIWILGLYIQSGFICMNSKASSSIEVFLILQKTIQ